MVTCIVSDGLRGTTGCEQSPETHLLARSSCGRWGTAYVCRRHAIEIACRQVPYFDECDQRHQFTHVADHPLAPECRHPDGTWEGDRCVIPGLIRRAHMVGVRKHRGGPA